MFKQTIERAFGALQWSDRPLEMRAKRPTRTRNDYDRALEDVAGVKTTTPRSKRKVA